MCIRDSIYTNLVGTNITGSSAEFTIRKNAQVYTTVLITDAGSDYNVGSTIVISGSNLGGVSPANNAIVTVTEVDSNGGVVKVSINGTASTGDATYTELSGTTSEGSGATWDIEVVGADPTTFDGSSVRFIAPVDMYSNTQEYDRYLVFPYKTILDPAELSGPVGWKNNSNVTVTWNNNSNNAVTWINNNT